jgi:hypothetical protein
MGSIARKRRRELMRKSGLSKESAEKVISITAEANRRQQRYSISVQKEIYRRAYKKSAVRHQAQVLAYFMGYLAFECGWGKKRLEDFLRGATMFVEQQRNDGMTELDIAQALQSEKKFDFVAVYEKICAEVKEHDIERKRTAHRLKKEGVI